MAITPAGAPGDTAAIPPEPAPPPARSAPIDTDSTTVSRPAVRNSPATSGPEAGLQTREPAPCIVTVATSAGTRFPNASRAWTRTLSGAPAVQAREAGVTRSDAVAPGCVAARMPTGASELPLTKTESTAGAAVGARYRTASLPEEFVTPLCDPGPPVVPPFDSRVPAALGPPS